MPEKSQDKFPYTPEGYSAAKEWLIETGNWDYVSSHGQSTDGWSIVQTANVLWDKQQENKK